MNINSTIRRLTADQATKDGRLLPSARIKREKSKNEREAEYHPQGYGLYICLHDKSYYEVCTSCKRTKREAQANLFSL